MSGSGGMGKGGGGGSGGALTFFFLCILYASFAEIVNFNIIVGNRAFVTCSQDNAVFLLLKVTDE